MLVHLFRQAKLSPSIVDFSYTYWTELYSNPLNIKHFKRAYCDYFEEILLQRKDLMK